ncbi:MAG: hypothetical protein Q9214_006699, partial [Letrouitia sp. 1 TL-2023]
MSRDFVGPVSSGPFRYSVSSGLLVEIVDHTDTYDIKRHARCSPSYLHSLLTWVDPGPVLTKKGKPKVRQPPPHEDKPAHFYEAQLIHYGLEPFTSKAAAKKALLEAIENADGELKVSDSVKNLERRMKEEYDRKKVKKEKEYREERRRREEKEREDTRKRKRVEKELTKEILEDCEKLGKKVKTSPEKK